MIYREKKIKQLKNKRNKSLHYRWTEEGQEKKA